MKNSGFTFRKRLASFRYAFNGIRLLIQKEHNAWIHCFATICVIIAGFSFGLSQTEWMGGRDRNRSRIIGRSNQFIH